MLKGLKQVITTRSAAAQHSATHALSAPDVVWAMGSFCALHRKPFDAQLLLRQFPPPYGSDSLILAARALGFKAKREAVAPDALTTLHLPCLVLLSTQASDTEATVRPALLVQASAEQLVVFHAGTNEATTLDRTQFGASYTGQAVLLAPTPAGLTDPDSVAAADKRFGFRWFVPELLKHKKVWGDVLGASLVIQLLALGMPLFTQVIIDKVVVHHTQSTLAVIAIGLIVFMISSAVLSWVRQYLVLHTGNRVDAVLGAAVFDHLFKLPPRYFEHRPTGVIAARLRGVDTVREFVASAAVTLMLDAPFLVIFAAIMFYYSVTLTFIALALIGVIVVLSLVVAPIFRERLNEQFLLGARNQAFITEYVAGLETVKSLQMEPQLKSRYNDFLADYLRSGFAVRQLANSYNTAANLLEQTMATTILIVGAWIVMHDSDFSIGMLVAFQMFSSRLSQPMLRMVGLWQQFQQAKLSVLRLGDVMNAPAEPYAVLPNRVRDGRGQIDIRDLSFRYAENLPFLYEHFALGVEPGAVVAIMGPSGCGKSTLAKLLQGFYLPSGGTIRIDGSDVHHLSANELRNYFGVVPQEIVLFSGTLYENLQMANPHASFEDIVRACRMAEIHEAIEALPQGYQTEIGERGIGLSGGQKQRVAIARALLKNPKILIFDEATSSLDAATAEHFAATVNQLRGKVTMLFIAHALPKNLQVDSIVQVGAASEPLNVVQRPAAGGESGAPLHVV